MAFGAVIGSTAFFIVHGFRQSAEEQEKKMVSGDLSDISKVFYLEIIDATFSIDGVTGAFAFTLAVPLIIIGNGIGALIVRELTIRNVDTIRNYRYLKNGAMYSIFCLGFIMILDSFGFEIPAFVSPVITFGIVGYLPVQVHPGRLARRDRVKPGGGVPLRWIFTSTRRTGHGPVCGGTVPTGGCFCCTFSYRRGCTGPSFPTGQTLMQHPHGERYRLFSFSDRAAQACLSVNFSG